MSKQIINMGNVVNMSLPGGIDAGEAVSQAVEISKRINKKLDETPGLRDLTRIMYTVEHVGMPYMFFKNPSLFANEHEIHDVIGVLWQSSARMEKVAPPTMPEFKIEKLEVEGADVTLVRPPFPIIMPLCYRIAMIVPKDGGEMRFLTQERTMSPLDSMLCGWKIRPGTEVMDVKSLAHDNYGIPLNRTRATIVKAVQEVIVGNLKPHPQVGFTYR